MTTSSDTDPETGQTDTGYRRMTTTLGQLTCMECGALIGSPDQHNQWHDEMATEAAL